MIQGVFAAGRTEFHKMRLFMQNGGALAYIGIKPKM